MYRTIFEHLINWKKQTKRKVILVRGARQVGKTYIIRELGKTFDSFLEINFEKDTDVKSLFDKNLNPKRIITELSIYYKQQITAGKTLLFFDEIQACPRAIEALRFFYEDIPDLHLVAAGSLLEFALADLPSFGVGRLRSIYMYPMSFDEFLIAKEEEGLLKLKQEANVKNPLKKVFHDKLVDLLKIHLIIGGMPDAVNSYCLNNDITEVFNILTDITTSYYSDFVKYNKRIPVDRLRETLDSVVLQSGGKFIFSKVNAISNPTQAKNALELLTTAGLVHKVHHTSGQGIPLGAGINHKKFKAFLLDTGIIQNNLNLNLSEILLSKNTDMLNKGSIAEIFTGLEMIKYSSPYKQKHLFYWHREKRGSNAEVDYLLTNNETILPVEIKSGTSGKMQSLNLFLRERKINKGKRISLENFAEYGKIEILPLHSISNLNAGGWLD
ncbi:MAG: ATP-binding protein [Chlorobi bacterium]|nr:ATP-binding protein [Chlorobiota bacterium]